MNNYLKSFSRKSKYATALGLLFTSNFSLGADPVSQYIVDGKVIPNWVSYAGNSLNWYVPIENGKGTTERKSLIVTPVKENGETTALNLKWTGKQVKNQWGGNTLGDSFFSLGKHNIDISSVEDVAALAFDIKVLKTPNKNVSINMQCENSNKCKGEFPIKYVIKNLEKDSWQQLPIPLNCFNKEGNFNFEKVTNIFSIATQGKLEIQIKNVQLVGLPAGDKGCKG